VWIQLRLQQSCVKSYRLLPITEHHHRERGCFRSGRSDSYASSRLVTRLLAVTEPSPVASSYPIMTLNLVTPGTLLLPLRISHGKGEGRKDVELDLRSVTVSRGL